MADELIYEFTGKASLKRGTLSYEKGDKISAADYLKLPEDIRSYFTLIPAFVPSQVIDLNLDRSFQ